MPLSTNELVQRLENNQSTLLFQYRGDTASEIVRNHDGEFKRIGNVIEKYPPIYLIDLAPDWWGRFIAGCSNRT
jgi:hypothetical protein